MPYAAIDDLTMYYEEHGVPGGPRLVLLHGFGGSAAVWQRLLPVFGERYRLLVPEWRGHSRTNNPAGLKAMTHRQFARDVIALCRTLGVDRAIFCGQSSGAMQLLTLALEAPDLVRALVLAAGTHFYSGQLREWWRQRTLDDIPPEQRSARQQVHTAMGPDHWRSVALAFNNLGSHTHADDFPEREVLRGIQAPTLILHGDRDWFFPVEVPVELYRLLPDAELCILPQTGHGLVGQRPEWFSTIVLDFLARRAP